MALLSQLDLVYIKTFVAKCEGSHCTFGDLDKFHFQLHICTFAQRLMRRIHINQWWAYCGSSTCFVWLF